MDDSCDQTMKPETPSDCACLFPIRSYGDEGDRESQELKATQIECEALREVAGYCDQHGVAVDCLLMGIWAVILKQLTDNITIRMGFQRTATRCEIGVKSRMEVASSSFGPDTPLRELLESGQWTTADSEATSFNTAVAMCVEELVPTTGGISVTEHHNVSKASRDRTDYLQVVDV